MCVQRLAKNTLLNALHNSALTPTVTPTLTPQQQQHQQNTAPPQNLVQKLIAGANAGFELLHTTFDTAQQRSNFRRQRDSLAEESVSSEDNPNPNQSLGRDSQEERASTCTQSQHDLLDKLALVLNEYWTFKKRIAAGSEPERIRKILKQAPSLDRNPDNYPDKSPRLLSALCTGAALCGAGGGGFAVLVLRRGVSREQVQAVVDAMNEDGNVQHESNGNSKGAITCTMRHQAQEMVQVESEAGGRGKEEKGETTTEFSPLYLHSVALDRCGITSTLHSSIMSDDTDSNRSSDCHHDYNSGSSSEQLIAFLLHC